MHLHTADICTHLLLLRKPVVNLNSVSVDGMKSQTALLEQMLFLFYFAASCLRMSI